MDLEMTFEWVSSDVAENQAYISLETGRIYWVSDDAGAIEEEDAPDDVDDPAKYTLVPSKRDLDLGTPLVFDFTRRHLPQHYDLVRDTFRRPGAYVRFKGLLERERMLQEWYTYSAAKEAEALEAWCEEEGLELGP